MKNHWRKLASLLPSIVERKIYQRHFLRLHHNWVKSGQTGAVSHLFKQNLIKKTADRHGITTLIETGTYLGDMVFAMQKKFAKIISIELSENFYQNAAKRFRSYGNVTIVQGDSANVLHQIVSDLKDAALFWLDGHYSGGQTAKGQKECPVYEELNSILSSPYHHVVLIDDARLFVGQNDYPTAEDLKKFVLRHRPHATIQLNGDVFVLTLN